MELTGETKDWGRGMAEAFSMVKDQAPLVHMIANYVTASFCADAMAAIGARPLMAQAPEEGCTCESLAAQAGLSSVTVRRYLTYLTQQGEVVSRVNYDTGGRPSLLYYLPNGRP